MSGEAKKSSVIFPPWVDDLVKLLGIGGGFFGAYTVVLVTFGFSPKTTDVNYMPEQPIPYSHKLHVGELGLDCRYCHTGVEKSAAGAIPPTSTCMNCHHAIRRDSELLEPLRESYATGNPVEWVRVHDLADFSYFNHSAHVTRGVSCVSCHGRIDKMEVVYQAEPLSMGWCLDCHRDPAKHLRPVDKVTDLAWEPEDLNGDGSTADEQYAIGTEIMKQSGLLDANGEKTWRMRQLTSCSTCHR